MLLDDDSAVETLKAAPDRQRPLLAFNCVGGESALRLMNLLGPGGIHVTYGAMARRPLTVPNGLLIFKDLQIRGLWITKWIENAPHEELEEVYGQLAGALASGALSMPVDRTYPLGGFSDAIARLSEPDRNGKVLLIP